MHLDALRLLSSYMRFHTYVYARKSRNPSVFHFIDKIPLETHSYYTSFKVWDALHLFMLLCRN